MNMQIRCRRWMNIQRSVLYSEGQAVVREVRGELLVVTVVEFVLGSDRVTMAQAMFTSWDTQLCSCVGGQIGERVKKVSPESRNSSTTSSVNVLYLSHAGVCAEAGIRGSSRTVAAGLYRQNKDEEVE
ncbi:hypothetical protein MHYP_G00073080 [Metynnis hypsauchen]